MPVAMIKTAVSISVRECVFICIPMSISLGFRDDDKKKKYLQRCAHFLCLCVWVYLQRFNVNSSNNWTTSTPLVSHNNHLVIQSHIQFAPESLVMWHMRVCNFSGCQSIFFVDIVHPSHHSCWKTYTFARSFVNTSAAEHLKWQINSPFSFTQFLREMKNSKLISDYFVGFCLFGWSFFFFFSFYLYRAPFFRIWFFCCSPILSITLMRIFVFLSFSWMCTRCCGCHLTDPSSMCPCMLACIDSIEPSHTMQFRRWSYIRWIDPAWPTTG